MKTLAASEADWKRDDRLVNQIEDFWSADVSGLYQVVSLTQTLQFRWERWDEREPDVRGEETLILSLPLHSQGRTFTLPNPEIRADYTMATPSKGQGARAVELTGIVRVVEQGPAGVRLWIDLEARMERIDARGVEFDEAVRGMFTLPTRS